MRNRDARCALLCGAALLLAGCVPPPASPAPPAEVEGVIEYDGEPVPDGIVSFVPEDGGPGSGGGPIRRGRFRVDAGCKMPAGRYRVEVRWAKPTGNKIPAGYMTVDETKEALPDKYNAASTLTAELAPGPNTVDLKLEK